MPFPSNSFSSTKPNRRSEMKFLIALVAVATILLVVIEANPRTSSSEEATTNTPKGKREACNNATNVEAAREKRGTNENIPFPKGALPPNGPPPPPPTTTASSGRK